MAIVSVGPGQQFSGQQPGQHAGSASSSAGPDELTKRYEDKLLVELIDIERQACYAGDMDTVARIQPTIQAAISKDGLPDNINDRLKSDTNPQDDDIDTWRLRADARGLAAYNMPNALFGSKSLCNCQSPCQCQAPSPQPSTYNQNTMDGYGTMQASSPTPQPSQQLGPQNSMSSNQQQS
jgi:hypothetical protein